MTAAQQLPSAVFCNVQPYNHMILGFLGLLAMNLLSWSLFQCIHSQTHLHTTIVITGMSVSGTMVLSC